MVIMRMHAAFDCCGVKLWMFCQISTLVLFEDTKKAKYCLEWLRVVELHCIKLSISPGMETAESRLIGDFL